MGRVVGLDDADDVAGGGTLVVVSAVLVMSCHSARRDALESLEKRIQEIEAELRAGTGAIAHPREHRTPAPACGCRGIQRPPKACPAGLWKREEKMKWIRVIPVFLREMIYGAVETEVTQIDVADVTALKAAVLAAVERALGV